MDNHQKYSLAVDIGGTFTDTVLCGSEGQIWVDKTLTTHEDLAVSFFHGVDRVLGKSGLSASDIDDTVVHATTLVTNALIERKGVRTAFITTHGFKDVLTIRDEWRYDMFDLQLENPHPVVSPADTFVVRERVLADGSVDIALVEDEIRAIAAELRQAGIGSVAVCLLNAYVNPVHERRIKEILAGELPDLSVSISAEVAPQIREYLRATTTTVNAYVAPIVQPYLARLADTLTGQGFPNDLIIMLSNGGVVGYDVAGSMPVRMIESGPAAGALAASYYSKLLGTERLISFDMGGTTAKACLIDQYEPSITNVFEVDRAYRLKPGSGLPVAVPSVDLIEIGAGGGSIAWIDSLGLLKVGPRSAGAMPGPACYDRGGQSATVTDSNLVLGLLDADHFLGGEMPLDMSAARQQLGTLSAKLDQTVEEVAAGIFAVVSENMALAVRAYIIEKGIDARGMALLAFGGAGPVHACQVADLLESGRVIFPQQASVFSAFGTLVAPPRLDLVRSMISRLDQLDWTAVISLYAEMGRQALDALTAAGSGAKDIAIGTFADLRYHGQLNEITVELPGEMINAKDTDAVRTAFEKVYEVQYGVRLPEIPVEVVSWRIVATGTRSSHTVRHLAADGAGASRTKFVHLWNRDAVVVDRAGLAPGVSIVGPTLIEERETTIVIPPEWTAEVDATGCIIATKRD